MLIPGGNIALDFPLYDSQGANANALALPTGVLVRNGVDTDMTVTITNKTTGLYTAAATLGAWSAGDIVQLRVTATVDGVTAAGIVFVDTLVAEDAALAVEVSGPRVSSGELLTLVQGDDYVDESAIVVTLTGSGLGALVTETWSLWLNTRGAAPVTAAGDADAPDADTLVLTFELSAEQTAALLATSGLWGVKRATESASMNPRRGKLLVLPDLEVQQ